MINKDVLIDIGLTKNETDVYLYLLGAEESLAGDIAKKTKISRTYVYDTIEKLMQKGLVSYVIRNGKRYYRAADPNKVIDYLRYQEANVQNILPELLLLRKPLSKKAHVEVYDGPEGMKNVLTLIIKTKPKEWCVLGSSGKSIEVIGHEFADIFENRRFRSGINMKIVMNNTPKAREASKRLKSYPLTEVRYIGEKYESPVSTYVFGDYVALMLWMPDKPVAVLIKDKDIAHSFEKHFNVMWALAEK